MDCCVSILLAVVAGLLALYYYTTRVNRFSELNIPTPTALPLIGNMWKPLMGLVSHAGMIKEFYNVHPTAKYVGGYGLSMPIVVIRDPELMKTVIVKHFDHFPEHRAFVGERSDPLFGRNLFALRGERWKEVRNLLTPAFTSSKMKSMFVLMNECGTDFSNALISLPMNDRVLDLKDIFSRYTNDVIATCAFGISVNSMKDRENPFYMFGKKATDFGTISSLKFAMLQLMPGLMSLLGIKFISDDVTSFFMKLMAETIKTREEKNIVRPDMIQLMMEHREQMDLSVVDMTAQAFIFFFGGFETSSTMMSFAAHEIGVNPDVQEKLHEEIDKVLEENDGKISYESLNNMPYLDAVINEALRMYPVAVGNDRNCVKDFELPPALPGLKPFTIKKGDMVLIPTYGIQHDPYYFDEPEKFNPDRFIKDAKRIASSGAYIPFGMGPRMCIGNRFALLQAKVVLFHVLARCQFAPCAKTTVPMQFSKRGFALTAKNGFWMKVQPRSNPYPSVVASVDDSNQ